MRSQEKIAKEIDRKRRRDGEREIVAVNPRELALNWGSAEQGVDEECERKED